MSTATALVPKNQDATSALSREVTYEPTTFAEAIAFAEYISKSDLVPADYRGKPANCFVAMQHGKELGISPMQALQGIANINGRPGVFGDLQLAIVQAHRDYESHKEWIEGEGDKMVAHFQIKRRGHELHKETFSVADAKTAGLWDSRPTISVRGGQGTMANPSPWFRYPKRMLKFRARSFGLRDTFADALKGMKSAEELGDYPTIEGTLAPGDIRPSRSEPEKDEVIGTARSNEWTAAVKAAGIKRDAARKFLNEDLQVETSLLICESQIDRAYAWIKEQQAKAEASKEPVPSAAQQDSEQRPGLTEEEETVLKNIDAGFGILGIDLVQQAEMREKYKDDLPGLMEELSRMADEGSAN